VYLYVKRRPGVARARRRSTTQQRRQPARQRTRFRLGWL